MEIKIYYKKTEGKVTTSGTIKIEKDISSINNKSATVIIIEALKAHNIMEADYYILLADDKVFNVYKTNTGLKGHEIT